MACVVQAARPCVVLSSRGQPKGIPRISAALRGAARPHRGVGSLQGRLRKLSSPAALSSADEQKSTADPEAPVVPTSDGVNAKLAASLGVVGGLVLLAGAGVLLKDQVKAFLDFFVGVVESYGPLGYLAYIVVYAMLELLAVPAIPLTATAGVIFGTVPGTAVVSVAATLAATGAFLVARYVARDKVMQYASTHPKFKAIDAAIGRDGFRVVLLLRLSPLLPLAASNYLYGLTSVDLGSYLLGSWLGMLPGTAAYVAAGAYSKQLLEGGGALEGIGWWQVAVALGVTGLAVGYIGRLASKALADLELDGHGNNKAH